MRRFLLTLSVVFALAVLANPADAQFKIGAQGALISSIDAAGALDLSGTKGFGARIMIDPPLFPLALVGSGVYYSTDCTDCSYWTASVAVQLRLPLPIVAPYVLAGYQTRRSDDGLNTGTGSGPTTENGPMVGVGVQLNFGLSLFLEATLELNEDDLIVPGRDTSPIVIKGGIMFG